METYSVITSWGIFAGAVLVAVYYYWPEQRNPSRGREDATQTAKKRRTEQDGRQKQNRRLTPERVTESSNARSTGATAGSQGGSDATRKRKALTKEPAKAPAPTVVVQDDEPEEIDINTKQFAQQMAEARKGAKLGSRDTKEQRVKTVKQSSALNTPVLSSGSSQADDDLSPAVSPSYDPAGGVSDMLEPAAPGPSTLRVTAPTKPQREKVARQPKQEETGTKKQRQNRQRVEAQRLQREADEKERKALEEKQRRAAREARGEPARNGMPVSKPPVQSAWQPAKSVTAYGTSSASVATENQNGPLLDTFEAESNSSSNGAPEVSTAATSTTSTRDIPAEEDQVAQAMRQSEDESGWTTVAQPKKQQKKKASNGDVTPVEPVLTNKTNVMPTKATANGKPKGFQALEVEYEQRTDADPNDSSNWDA
ncbi:hypothetical protein LTR37_003847 [Vermiconidia calcicola]|uniref:Uncharacterized protein n=1 Tax=Vermiconidia calcicola TaxID=1690605 RepID=A0ACC3NPK8_9PEZI|nr:hypothetical protein LTR37_003847 [Vermiconidia calcicola]